MLLGQTKIYAIYGGNMKFTKEFNGKQSVSKLRQYRFKEGLFGIG